MKTATSVENLELALIELEYAVADLAQQKASATGQAEIAELGERFSQLRDCRDATRNALRTLVLMLDGRASGRAA